MENASGSAALVIQICFTVYIVAVLLRFLLQWVRADFRNSFGQLLIKATNPPLLPLRRIIPGWGGVDLAALVLLLGLAMLELFLANTTMGIVSTLPGIFVGALAEILSITLSLYKTTILIQVILSWFAPDTFNPLSAAVYRMNEPLLAPARRLIPPIGGFDLSPLVVVFILHLLQVYVLARLIGMSGGLG